MEAFSIIDIPKYQQKKLCQSAKAVGVDYKRFNIKDRKILEGLFYNSYMASNDTNSNVSYNGKIAHVRVKSPRGRAQQVVATFEEVGAVPFCYYEEYGVWQGLKWSVARIDFYGAFFHFKDDLPIQYRKLYDYLMEQSKKNPWKVRVTRVDIAFDFDYQFPQKWHNWINPAKHSQREVEMYKHQWLYNSYGYLAEKNTGYWVRIYDKTVETGKHHKEAWYGWKENIDDNWTRIEFEFYPPYSTMWDNTLIDMCQEKILGKKVSLGMLARPTYTFNIENAYKYFERYAKNHGIDMQTLIHELQVHHDWIETNKDYYWLTNE